MFRRMQREWLQWLVAALPAVLILTLFVAPAMAQGSTPVGPELIGLLQQYGIVKGDERGNLNLDQPIKRAEVATILIRALGKEADAISFRNRNTFTDARGHWAEGYLGYAAAAGLFKGDGNGRVRPEDFVTNAEALTLILRLVGKEPATGEWPMNAIFAAIDLKVMPPGVTIHDAGATALRGPIFQSLATAITTVKTPQGKTFLQTYVDPTPPVLAVTQPAASTRDAVLHLTGTVRDALTVTVNGQPAAIAGTQFNADVPLQYGANKIVVVAMDRAGNASTAEVSVNRLYPVASLTLTGPARVKPGGKATYTVSARDSAGNVTLLTGATGRVEGNIGLFDLQSGTFVAASAPGRGRIVVAAGEVTASIDVEVTGLNAAAAKLAIRAASGNRSMVYTRPMTVQVEVQDAGGRFLPDDEGRPVTLTATGVSGLTVSPAVAYTEGGVATFTVRAGATGAVTLQARADGLLPGADSALFTTNLRVRLSANPGSLTIGGATGVSRITATLVNEGGFPVPNNTDSDIFVRLTANPPNGTLTDDTLKVSRGAVTSANSGDDALFTPGAQEGPITLSGTVISGESLTVEPVTVNLTLPALAAGSYWDVQGTAAQTPNVPGTFTVRLAGASGNTVPGSFAFQLSVSTSNNEPKVNGLPLGLSLTLGNTGLNPVSDGIAEGTAGDGSDVVVRTSGDPVTFRINYDKPGLVLITVLPAGNTDNAYSSAGVAGAAAGSPGVTARTLTLTYGGTPTAVRLEVDSDLGQKLSVGGTANSPARSFTLRAVLTDARGYWIPNSRADLTLARVSGSSTTPPATLTTAATNGQATFIVYATATPGDDTYKVTASLSPGVESPPVTLQVRAGAPAAPAVLAARGTRGLIPGSLNYVAPDDTGLEVELAQDTAQHWAIVKVYREDGSSPVYTSDPMDLSAPAPRLVVPKEALVPGVARYQVTLFNGYGESPRTLLPDAITSAVYVQNITLTGARYQRSTRLLTVYGSGFGTAADAVNPALLTITDASTGRSITLQGATATIVSNNQITLDLNGTAGASDLENPILFSGSDVSLTAGAGWYSRTSGEQSAAITAGAQVRPMAHIDHAVLDRTNGRLSLVGQGFSTGTLNLARLKLQADGASDILLNAFPAAPNGDGVWVITLHANALAALHQNGGYVLNAEEGWFAEGAWSQPALASVRIYTQVGLSSVTYDRAAHRLTLRGSGFSGGTVTPGNVQVTDLSSGHTVSLTGTGAPASDSEIVFTLDPSARSTLDLENGDLFQGTDIYVFASAGWFTDAGGRPAAAIPVRTLRLPQP